MEVPFSFIGFITVLCLLVGTCFAKTVTPVYTQPEQVHLSWADDPTQMVVSWVTQNETNSSTVEYGALGQALNRTAVAQSMKYLNQGKNNQSRVMWLHKAVMTGLVPSNRYTYHVGSPTGGWSDLFFFQAKRVDAKFAPRLAIYGDLGNEDGRSMPYLQKAVQSGQLDAILHIGDYAYDMDDDLGLIGDAFMQQIQPIAAYVPYMTLPGNHEKMYNFSQYKNRFNMPGAFQSMMYSMVIGPARIIMFNTEVFYKNESPDQSVMYTQYRWLEDVLKAANMPDARAAAPWLIVMGHRPMYCSTNDGPSAHCNNPANPAANMPDARAAAPWLIVMGHRPMYCSTDDGPYEHCNNPKNPVRVGINNVTREYSLEDLFYKYGVDMHFYAHEHSYERLFPLYKDTMCNGTKAPYTNPTGPVHIITGSAGDREGQTKFDKIPHNYSAFRSDDYGYTLINIFNGTHITMDQTSIDKGGAIIDHMDLIMDKHGPGVFTCRQGR